MGRAPTEHAGVDVEAYFVTPTYLITFARFVERWSVAVRNLHMQRGYLSHDTDLLVLVVNSLVPQNRIGGLHRPIHNAQHVRVGRLPRMAGLLKLRKGASKQHICIRAVS